MRKLALFLVLGAAGVLAWGQQVQFRRGDANADRTIDISDAVHVLLALFVSGDTADCADAADANDSGKIDIADAVHVLGYLFARGTPPPSPFSGTGCDPTADSLGCHSYPGGTACDTPPADMIFGHTHTNVAAIPEQWIEAAKANFRIYYGHTSHGSQIMTGIAMIRSDLLNYNNGDGTLQIRETTTDLGSPNTTAWATTTRTQLDRSDNNRNVVMWAWCGELSSLDPAVVAQDYLGGMSQLEADYPDVKFIYMTGHLDGRSDTAKLHLNNEQIRAFCRENGKILFDFADIESYDPDGNYYYLLGATDNCDYRDPVTREVRNWAIEWCTAHPEECIPCDSCAHSQCLNCQLKGKVFWWMMARMAGWNGQ